MADRVERLTNLLALLLETAEPLSLVQIAGELDGQYPESQTARRAAFERDKAALRQIGVPIEQEIVPGGEYAGQTRYWIDRDRYELSGLQLDEDEMRALQVAMAATRPGSASGQEALWKVGAGLLDQVAPVTAIVPESTSLPTLREAVSDKIVGPLHVSRRRPGPSIRGGCCCATGSGTWWASTTSASDRRTYRIDRIEGDVDAMPDRRFDRPADFDPRDAFPDDPKLIGADARGPRRPCAHRPSSGEGRVRELGAERVVAEHDDGSIEVDVPCANLAAFRSWVLGYLEHAEVLAPRTRSRRPRRLARGGRTVQWIPSRAAPGRGAPAPPARHAALADGTR